MGDVIKIGMEAPAFTLVDTEQNPTSLLAFRGEWVFLVFNRGFAWPYCRRHLAQLRQREPEYQKRGVQVIIVCPDGPKAIRRYWRENEMPFPGLADIGNKVADQYAQEVNVLKLGRMPAQFLVDPQGVVRYAHYSESMSDIPGEEQVLEMIDQVKAEQSA